MQWPLLYNHLNPDLHVAWNLFAADFVMDVHQNVFLIDLNDDPGLSKAEDETFSKVIIEEYIEMAKILQVFHATDVDVASELRKLNLTHIQLVGPSVTAGELCST